MSINSKKKISQNPNKLSEYELSLIEGYIIDAISEAPEEVFRRILLRLIAAQYKVIKGEAENLALIRALPQVKTCQH
jgi:hypothetical protein